MMSLLFICCVLSTTFVHGRQSQAPISFCYNQGTKYQYCTGPDDVSTNATANSEMGWCCNTQEQLNQTNPGTCGQPQYCTQADWNQTKALNNAQINLYGSFYPGNYQKNRVELCTTPSPYLIATAVNVPSALQIMFAPNVSQEITVGVPFGSCVYQVQARAPETYPKGSQLILIFDSLTYTHVSILKGMERYNTTIFDGQNVIRNQSKIAVDVTEGLILTATNNTDLELAPKPNATFKIRYYIELPADATLIQQVTAGVPVMFLYGVPAAILLLVIMLIVCCCICCKRRKKVNETQHDNDMELTDSKDIEAKKDHYKQQHGIDQTDFESDQERVESISDQENSAGFIPLKTSGGKMLQIPPRVAQAPVESIGDQDSDGFNGHSRR